MNRGSKILAIVGVIAGIVIIGAVVGWWGSRTSKTGGGESVVLTSNPPPIAKIDPTVSTNKVPRKPYHRIKHTNASPAQASATVTNVTAEWEDKVDAILTTEGKDSDKAKELLQLFPTLPEDGKEEVAQHLSNLVADEDYAPLGKLFLDPTLPESVLDVLMADVLNRPNAVKLPTLLEVARNPQHPGAAEAKDLLELFLDPDDDYGNDWNKWQAKMDQWLKENPD
jgi:hypothetical protein